MKNERGLSKIYIHAPSDIFKHKDISRQGMLVIFIKRAKNLKWSGHQE